MVCPTGAVSVWKFDGDGSDSVGTNTATFPNGSTFVTGHVQGQAIQFDGVDDYADMGLDSSLQTASVSISVWVDVTNIVDSNDAFPIFGNTDSTPDGYTFWFDDRSVSGRTNGLYFYIRNTSGYFWQCNNALTGLSGWHHLVVSYDTTSGDVKIYVDGVSQTVSGTSQPGVLGAWDHEFVAGAWTLGSGVNYYFDRGVNWSLDALSVYDKELSSLEVSDLYNSGAGLDCPPSNAAPSGTSLSKVVSTKSPVIGVSMGHARKMWKA